jgi:hypothetical protein
MTEAPCLLMPISQLLQEAKNWIYPLPWPVIIPVCISIVAGTQSYIFFRKGTNPPKRTDVASQRFYNRMAILLPLGTFAMTWWLTYITYEDKQRSAGEFTNQLQNFEGELESSRATLEGVRKTMESSESMKPELRLSLIENEMNENRHAEATLSNTVTTFDAVNLKSLNELNISTSNLLAKKRDDSELAVAKEKITLKKSEQEEQTKQAQKDKELNDKCLAFFDHALIKMQSDLEAISNESGQKLSFDFSNGPTIHNTNLMNEGLIIDGTNHLWLGTNICWSFEIATDGNVKKYYKYGPPPKQLKILIRGIEGAAYLLISADTVTLYTPNGPKTEPPPGLPWMGGTRPLFAESTTTSNIDLGIIRLLAEAQRQCPLSTR